MNEDYPPHPGPWRQPECDAFNAAVAEFLEQIRQELGADFEIVNEQPSFKEDADLDRYLQNPRTFKR